MESLVCSSSSPGPFCFDKSKVSWPEEEGSFTRGLLPLSSAWLLVCSENITGVCFFFSLVKPFFFLTIPSFLGGIVSAFLKAGLWFTCEAGFDLLLESSTSIGVWLSFATLWSWLCCCSNCVVSCSCCRWCANTWRILLTPDFGVLKADFGVLKFDLEEVVALIGAVSGLRPSL